MPLPQNGRRAMPVPELLHQARRGLGNGQPFSAADEVDGIAPLEAAEAEEPAVGVADKGWPRILVERAAPTKRAPTGRSRVYRAATSTMYGRKRASGGRRGGRDILRDPGSGVPSLIASIV